MLNKQYRQNGKNKYRKQDNVLTQNFIGGIGLREKISVSFNALISNNAFFIGIFIGFFACILVGKRVSETFAYDAPFTRFNEYLLRDTNFYPTASSMLNTVLQQSKPEQTLVLIGGNSILRGFGQGAQDLWSNRLQLFLGDQYKVFNFGMPTGSLQMNAAVIGEILRKQGRKVIIVTNSLTNLPNDDLLANWDNYIFLEAYYKDLLDNNFRKNNQKLESSWPRFYEVRLAQKLNSYLFFNDLWNFIGYRYFFTSWTSLTYYNWTGARAFFKDPDYPWVPRNKETYDLNIKKDVLILKNRIFLSAESEEFKSDREKSLSNIKIMMPEYLIKSTIIVLSSENPYLLSEMDDESRNKFDTVYSSLKNSWEREGYTTLRIGLEIPPEEWNDAVHLAAPGGTKLAAKLAPVIIDLNKKLYEFSSRPI